jgi:hypothetical protein
MRLTEKSWRGAQKMRTQLLALLMTCQFAKAKQTAKSIIQRMTRYFDDHAHDHNGLDDNDHDDTRFT